jgi:hypothetical protein
MNGQVERHSISSLSLRTGLNRAVLLGAIASGRLPIAERTQVGSRVVYDIKTESVEDFVAGFRQRLQARVDKLSADPFQRQQGMLQALRGVRDSFEAEQGLMTVDKLMEQENISREAAAYILNRYAERVEGGWKVSPEAMAKIRRHIQETRGGAAIVSKGGPYVA